ncbi:BZ3500_MvSof-1268-A1-R1_Chr2-2g05001 [Microbotryum saponariae]|uniref:GPI mannosyltransferase 2 n=1 Tax=Microbotryum saponariae TaxID=289078 RepID=A0A2X0L7T8_9BASI|nr:BZ3500_MvSof-1268-A1-R1_Chr2-2g05001 [Microbotryum saponariae]SDA00678.1 BZ3501_MvSof-1269-A2-R1_Chr2-2g04675 [Microbotryum saponariae]
MDVLAKLVAKTRDRPIWSLIVLCLALRVWTTALLWIYFQLLPSWERTSLHESFDDPTIAAVEAWNRWDTEHFVRIAVEGYKEEKETAFMPLLPMMMRWGAQGIEGKTIDFSLDWTVASAPTIKNIVLCGMALATVGSVAAVLSLYYLTSTLFDLQFAHITSLIYLFAPSPSTLHAVPYNEPFSAALSFLGMAFFFKQQYLLAAIAWGSGTAFRAQSIVLGLGFFGWECILRGPRRRSAKYEISTLLAGLPRFIFLSTISIAPFFLFELHVHREFCLALPVGAEPRPWCSTGLKISYSFVQSHYWCSHSSTNNGLFNYWRPLQIPNFMFAAPVLYYSILASYRYYRTNLHAVVGSTLPFLPARILPQNPALSPTSSFLHNTPLDVVPIVHLHTFNVLLFLFYSHVQIILRLCVLNPVLFWFTASLIRTDLLSASGTKKFARGSTRLGRAWWFYVLIWGQVSSVLWAVFLPPA